MLEGMDLVDRTCDMMGMSAVQRSVLITGASSGIGNSCALLFAARGYRVFGSSRHPERHAPDGFEMISMDVTSDESVARAVEAVLATVGHIDVVINNAGYSLACSVEDTTLAEAQQQFDTNFFGVLRICRAVLPSMRARGQGSIINIGSLGGLVGLPYQGLYSASKFALEGLTESLRHELRPFGVYVTIIEPGDIKTSITDNRILGEAARQSAYTPSFEQTLEIIQQEERNGPSAASVAELVVRVAELRRPAIRYTVGHLSQRSSAWAKRWMPASLFERAIRAYYRL
jgi:NAD(P)-dependent dehydrogenase (short-subunit alcohol dehydrogenase family)